MILLFGRDFDLFFFDLLIGLYRCPLLFASRSLCWTFGDRIRDICGFFLVGERLYFFALRIRGFWWVALLDNEFENESEDGNFFVRDVDSPDLR